MPEPPEYYLMKVVNLSSRREIEITHIWFDTNQPVHIDNRARPAPRLACAWMRPSKPGCRLQK